MTLPEVMRKMTYREFKLRLEWERQQWNKPSRSDHYLMQIAQILASFPGRRSKSAKIAEFILKWDFFKRKPKKNPTKGQAPQSWNIWSSTLRKFQEDGNRTRSRTPDRPSARGRF